MQLLRPGIFWQLIQDHAQLWSWILSSMSFIDIYEAKFDKLRVIMDVSFQPSHSSSATNTPPKFLYWQYMLHFEYFGLHHSHHIFLDFELVDTMHTNQSKHFTFRCRLLIRLCASYSTNLCLISILMPAANMPWTLSPVATVRWRKVTTQHINKCTSLASK
jgi:hypothetical protein